MWIGNYQFCQWIKWWQIRCLSPCSHTQENWRETAKSSKSSTKYSLNRKITLRSIGDFYCKNFQTFPTIQSIFTTVGSWAVRSSVRSNLSFAMNVVCLFQSHVILLSFWPKIDIQWMDQFWLRIQRTKMLHGVLSMVDLLLMKKRTALVASKFSFFLNRLSHRCSSNYHNDETK